MKHLNLSNNNLRSFSQIEKLIKLTNSSLISLDLSLNQFRISKRAQIDLLTKSFQLFEFLYFDGDLRNRESFVKFDQNRLDDEFMKKDIIEYLNKTNNLYVNESRR